jgi:hypothetical protein
MSNMHQLLIREGLRDGCGLLIEIYSNPREMVGHHIFGTLLVPNLNCQTFVKAKSTE